MKAAWLRLRFRRVKYPLLFSFLILAGPLAAEPVPEKGPLAMQRLTGAGMSFGGVAGKRIQANIDGWLLSAPGANPGMLEMFRLRDRLPAPQLVPWAGEFAGKYLISCVQALRQSDRADLKEKTAVFVSELLRTQDADGYLGPFPKARRLLGEWDLWGHYHVMQGLLQWHDFTARNDALTAVRRAADLICRIYLDGPRRVIDAGSPEMNMAVSHVLAELHRRTGEPRYLKLVREIEKDWERAGDYLRTGEQRIPFFKTPLPRWESLHDLQTLVELWRITGESRYRAAFISHWTTIREFDVRNSGAFSGGEQATGNAYAPTAIETCCTVAWMAITVDMLELTGDARAADALELSMLNGALGAQHPSGRWWTYNTPMDGDRKASAHDIVFQARAGTPELNCCSVNGPRAPGMLGDWAVMQAADATILNWHGPMKVSLPDKGLKLECQSHYPLSGLITWRIVSDGPQKLRFRIPGWVAGATVALSSELIPVAAGTWFEATRVWREGDTVEFTFLMPLRHVAGAREQDGKISVYRGPLLLAWDQKDNDYDEHAIPRLDSAVLTGARHAPQLDDAGWLLVEVPAKTGLVRLRDFASAGSNGTRYRSWLRTTVTPRDPGANGLVIRDSLRGEAMPDPGKLAKAAEFTPAGEAVALNGTDQMLTYALPDGWPRESTVSVRVRIRELPRAGQLGQIFSAWCEAGDDPLRMVVQDGRLWARAEPANAAGAGGISVSPGSWHHLAAVRTADSLTLYIDGEPVGAAALTPGAGSKSRLCALGGNPLYSGAPEFLAADFAGFALYNRALAEAEIASLAAMH